MRSNRLGARGESTIPSSAGGFSAAMCRRRQWMTANAARPSNESTPMVAPMAIPVTLLAPVRGSMLACVRTGDAVGDIELRG